MTDKDNKEIKEGITAVERTLVNQILVGRIDAAFLLGVSARTIDNLVQRGSLRPRRIGSRCLFLKSELETFAKKLARSA